MIDILQKQYNLVQGSREELLKFVENQVGANLNTPVTAFEWRTIRYMLVHIVGCYFHWLERFAVNRDIEELNNEDFTTVNKIRVLFGSVDEAMTAFLENFDRK